MEPIVFVTVQFLGSVQRETHSASDASETSKKQLLCLLSPLLRTKATANTSGRRLTDDEQTQAGEGGAPPVVFTREPPWLHKFATCLPGSLRSTENTTVPK